MGVDNCHQLSLPHPLDTIHLFLFLTSSALIENKHHPLLATTPYTMLLLKQLALAATAASFLVVPETTQTDEEAFRALPIDAYSATSDIPVHALSQSLDVPCANCKGKDARLSMDFAVEDGARLLLNGYELYPSADPWHGDLTAEVVKGNGKTKNQMLGYSLAVGPQAYDDNQALKVINAHTGEVLIGAVDMVSAEQAECTDVWCRVKEGWESAWKGIKAAGGCRKHKGHGHGNHDGKMMIDGGRPHGRPAHPGQEHHHWGKLMKNLAFSILLPVLTGITAGVGVAVFVMGLCSFVAIIVRSRRAKCRRSRRRSLKASPTEPAAEEEKTGLMDTVEDDVEAPPQYEARN